MKKILSLIMCLILTMSSTSLSVNADNTVSGEAMKTGNEVAAELASAINATQDDSCEVDENVVTLHSDVYLSETLVIPCGGAVVIDLNGLTICGPEIDFRDDDAKSSAIEVPSGAELKITGNGEICGEYGSRNFKYTDGGHGIYNSGTLTIENADVYGGNSAYRERSPEERNMAYGGYGIYNNGTLSISDCRIFGGDARQGYLGEAGCGICNKGTLVMQDSSVAGGNAYGFGEVPESENNEITYAMYGADGIINQSGSATLQNVSIWAGNGDTNAGNAVSNFASLTVCMVSMNGGYTDDIGGDGSRYGSSGLFNTGGGNATIEAADIYGESDRPAIMNNANLTINQNTYVRSYYIAIENFISGVLTVNDGEICGGETGILNQNTVIINSGLISCSGENARGNDIAKSGAIVNFEELTVNGGKISGEAHDAIEIYGIVNEGNATLNGGFIKGGYIYAEDSYAKAFDGEFVAGEDKAIMESDNEYDEYTKNVSGTSNKSFLKVIENNPGIDLADLINDINPDACCFIPEEDAIVLNRDLTLPETLEIDISGGATLDLNGYMISVDESEFYTIAVFEDTDLTIKNGSIEGPASGRAIANYGMLSIENCTIYGGETDSPDVAGCRALDNYAGGEVNIEGSYLYGGDNQSYAAAAFCNQGTAFIKSSEFCGGKGADDSLGYAIENSGTGLTIYSGKFIGGDKAIYGDSFIKGNNVYIQQSDDDYIYVHTGSTESIKPYMIVMQENTATQLAKIINEYDAEACRVSDNCVYMNKALEIENKITIPTGEEITFNTTDAAIHGICIPEGANLHLTGNGTVLGDASESEEIFVSDDAIVNLGTLTISDGTIIGGETNKENGGYAGCGIKNLGSLTVYGGSITGGAAFEAGSFAGSGILTEGQKLVINGGTVMGGNSTSALAYPGHGIVTNGASVILNYGSLAGGTGTGIDGRAIFGAITGGNAIFESDDDVEYTLISSSTPVRKYICADDGGGAEALVTTINLQKDNSAKISDDLERAVLLSDFENLKISHFMPIDLNGHSVSGTLSSDYSVSLTGSGYVNNIDSTDVYLSGKNLTVNTCGGRLNLTDGIVNNFTGGDIYMENGTINNTITHFGEIWMCGGTIMNGIVDQNNGNRIIVEGGRILPGSTGDAIYIDRNRSLTIYIDGGEIYGIMLNSVYREGEELPLVFVNGGTVIGGIEASLIPAPSGGGAGGGGSSSGGGAVVGTVSSTSETYIASLAKGLIIGKAGSAAISHSFITEIGTVVKESADGSTYTQVSANSSDMRYLKASLISEPEIDFGGGGTVGSPAGPLGNIFVQNYINNGTTASFDMLLYKADTIQGDVYVCVFEGDKFINATKYTAIQEQPVSVACGEGQKVKIFWWDSNLNPQSYSAQI